VERKSWISETFQRQQSIWWYLGMRNRRQDKLCYIVLASRQVFIVRNAKIKCGNFCSRSNSKIKFKMHAQLFFKMCLPVYTHNK
jgi:hypothetical protein